MRAVVLLLGCAVLVGCARMQAIEGDLTKPPASRGRSSGTSTGDSSQHSAIKLPSDATPQDLVAAMKQKGMHADLRPLPSYDRNGAVASLLIVRDPSVSEPPRVLVYFCESEGIARELVGLIGGDAFATGSFAIGPATQTPDNQALARKVRKSID